ncbi:hypothetical protein SPRG_20343 [Saprolegnia parasitica CBS 223.65]|uniref:Acyltransferase 3 domain-containing protein n=1 Tax=Saprolegnia parasitica (strain CBS 223.65) TaxID=695850 RepID=A0A067CFB4_SAPPC|nr:hypothetical protein SPRG_20343 [Saprolegnia parasitica CBS 223.65]KDO27875.1 hypothetical protein SPRG_20343 [Saprolegnia parasitica CBS 223.65]|eukprot:XP_012201460.1 hypothetical protein SPRG_20343 [Saprolegnia parasitica CBS 223.65]
MHVNHRASLAAADDDDDVLATGQLLSDHAPDAETKKGHAAPPTHVYRPDIDGLRTLAVVPVLVFHAYPTLFPGGFIGVDVFFVISGFLISGILFKEHARGKFTYTSFYERRVRRIFPTLIIVLSATLWLGYLYLMAPKLQAMAATIFAGTLFAANLQHRAFPGFWALLPTVGATLLIAAGPRAPFNHHVLSHAAVVYIGKISYCLYLWHWPLLVITKDRYPMVATRPFFAEPWVVLVISFVLSVATYEDVEMRLRRSKHKYITPVLVLGVVCIAAFAAAVHANPADFSMIEIGLKNAAAPALVDASVLASNASATPTLSQAQQAMKDFGWNEGTGEDCPRDSPYITNLIRPANFGHQVNYFSGEVKVINPGHEKDNGLLVVLGDSHADMSKPRFVKLFEDATANNDDKFPTIVINSWSARPLLSCRAEYFANLAMVHAVKPQAVLLIVHYFQYMHPGGPSDRPRNDIPACCYDDYLPCDEQNMDDVNAMWASLKDELTKLHEMGIKVFVVNQSPEYEHMNPWAWVSGETVILPTPFRKSVFNRDFQWLLDPLHATVKAANATLIDYADNYSNGDEITLTDAQGYPVFAFTQHLTAHFSRNYLTVVDQVVDAARLA